MKSKYRELLFILVLTGLALLALAWPTQKTLRTVAEAQGMWWSDCPGAPFCSPVSPLPSPTPRPTHTPWPTYAPLPEPTCLPTPTCPPDIAQPWPTATEYPTEAAPPTLTPWPTQPPFE